MVFIENELNFEQTKLTLLIEIYPSIFRLFIKVQLVKLLLGH